MIFSLNDALIPFAKKVVHNGKPVEYSWGNEDALLKWIENQNQKQISRQLGIAQTNKYPLIWLVEGWKAKENIPGIKFDKVSFYISCNSSVEALNENRVPNFETLYQIANDFIKQLKIGGFKIAENSTEYTERSNFGKGSKTETIDIWDTLILELDLIAYTKNMKKC